MNILKDGMEETNTINKQMDNLSREMETIKKNQVKIPEWILARYKRITVEWA